MPRGVTSFILLSMALGAHADAQLLGCMPNSPERQGRPGCSVIEDKRLPALPQQPVFWHIDEFESLAAAKEAVGPTSVAFTAHDSAWLSTIESGVSDHHGGKHRGVVGPLPVQPNRPYSMMIMSAHFVPGNFSNVHTHSGPEAWWILEGSQCLETTTSTFRAQAGEGSIVPVGETMRLVATGTVPRRSLVLVLHDAEHPATTILDNPPPLKSCQS